MNSISKPVLKAEIDLKAFAHNINYIRKKFPKSMIILPVKANAYGHGDIIISKEAEKIGIEYLAIARISEGIKLRENGIKLPILNFGVELEENIDLAIKYNIDFSISSMDYLKILEKKIKNKKITLAVHLKIDTGMRRLGCSPNEAETIAKHIKDSPCFYLKSVYSHFARSDESLKFTQKQTDLFLKIKNDFDFLNIKPDFYHLFNSGAILTSPETNATFAIRPGIMVYGYSPDSNSTNRNLKPVMTLKTKVINIKKVKKGTGISYGHTYITKNDTSLATIPLGYGDGFPRLLSNKFKVTIKNKNYWQRGTISMDLTVIEVDKNIKIGDEVIIFGNKKECINNAKDLAKLANTISYEITTAITDRVDRVIKN